MTGRGIADDAAVAWVFDPLPASGARRGGDPASHVFRPDLASFVREVIQNANDQRVGAPELHLRFVELDGGQLDGFLAALRWPGLVAHLRGAAETRGGRAVGRFLAELEQRRRLLVLVIEDRHTVGLTGAEHHGESHFRALCKDTLFSHKPRDSAGGSYGLGKSVLWAFSGLSLVLFNSTLSTPEPGNASPRLFGRVELPSHAEGGREFAGPGWFGQVVGVGRDQHAESVRGDAATALADALKLARRDATGTSIAIVGFRDPTADEERSTEQLAAAMQAAIGRNFWPALVMPVAPLTVWTGAAGPRPLLPERDLEAVRPFIDAYRGRSSTRGSLDEAGQVVVREVPLEVPGRVDGGAAVTGSVRLCVRLGDDDERHPHPHLGEVAWFRGPGMVVRYDDRRRLALGARPFHAVVACGEARAPGAVTDADRAIERFLRAAEPPGHDAWESTATLKAEYRRGYAKALEQLKQRVDDALRQIVVAPPRRGRQGPDRLRRLFPMGHHGAAAGGAAAFHVRSVAVWFEAGRWHLRGQVRPAVDVPRWDCVLALAVCDERGDALDPVAIERVDTGVVADVTVVDGVARLQVEAPMLVFTGASVPVAPVVGGRRAVTLVVTGRAGAP